MRFFPETVLCGALPMSVRTRSHRLHGGADPSWYALTVDCLQLFSTHCLPCESLHFGRSSLGQAFNLDVAFKTIRFATIVLYCRFFRSAPPRVLPSRPAFKAVLYTMYVLSWCAFPSSSLFSCLRHGLGRVFSALISASLH